MLQGKVDDSDRDHEDFCKDMEGLKVMIGFRLLEFVVLALTVFDCIMMY